MEGVEYRRIHHVWILTSHETNPFYTTLDLQMSLYRPLCYNSRTHCSLLQCLRTSVIIAGAHSHFVVSSFTCEGKKLPWLNTQSLYKTTVIKPGCEFHAVGLGSALCRITLLNFLKNVELFWKILSTMSSHVRSQWINMGVLLMSSIRFRSLFYLISW